MHLHLLNLYFIARRKQIFLPVDRGEAQHFVELLARCIVYCLYFISKHVDPPSSKSPSINRLI